MNICIYGAASDNINKEFIDATENLGREMAKRGIGLVFGGGAHGLMGAAVRGISGMGGKSIGIAPEFFRPDGTVFENCSEFYFTEDMRSRKALLEQKADAFIIAPGGTGTYDEFFEIYTLKRLKQLNKPIVIFNVRGYYEPLIELLKHTAREGFMDDKSIEMLMISDDVNEILDYIQAQVK